MPRWVIKVGDRHRIRLPADAAEAIPWLHGTPGPIVATAILDSDGGIRILGGVARDRFEAVAKRIETVADGPEDSAAIRALARHAAGRVSITFSRDPKRVTVALPAALRAMGAPSKGAEAVLFVLGERVELWDARSWGDQARSVDGRYEDLLEEVEPLLGPLEGPPEPAQ